MANSNKRDRSAGRILNGSFVGLLICIFLIMIFKSLVPSGHGGWSVIPSIDFVLLLGFTLCLICMIATYCYQAWTKNVDDYYEWLVSMGLLRPPFSKTVSSLFPKWLICWNARITPLVVVLLLCLLNLLMVRTLSFYAP